MKVVDIALISQILFFFLGKLYNLNLLLEIWTNKVLPFLIIYERYIQNKDSTENVPENGNNAEKPSLTRITQTIFNERSELKNTSSNSPEQNSNEN